MKTFLAYATLALLISGPVSHASDKFSGISTKLGNETPPSLSKHDIENGACADLALNLASGVDLQKGQTIDGLINTCNNLADQKVCGAAVEMLKESDKKSPLNCKGP